MRVHHPDELDALLTHLEQTSSGGEPAHYECRYRRHDGAFRWFMGRTAAVRDTDGKIIRWVGTLTDIDDRKRIEVELRAASRAKDQFLATLSHELRTPLTPVRLVLGALLDDPALPAHARDDLRLIERNVALETKLIDDLLDLTRITRGKLEIRPQLLDLNVLVADAVKSCCGTDALQKKLDVRLRLTAQRLARAHGSASSGPGFLQPAAQRGEVHACRRANRRLYRHAARRIYFGLYLGHRHRHRP